LALHAGRIFLWVLNDSSCESWVKLRQWSVLCSLLAKFVTFRNGFFISQIACEIKAGITDSWQLTFAWQLPDECWQLLMTKYYFFMNSRSFCDECLTFAWWLLDDCRMTLESMKSLIFSKLKTTNKITGLWACPQLAAYKFFILKKCLVLLKFNTVVFLFPAWLRTQNQVSQSYFIEKSDLRGRLHFAILHGHHHQCIASIQDHFQVIWVAEFLKKHKFLKHFIF
jgi:hypothetical protein